MPKTTAVLCLHPTFDLLMLFILQASVLVTRCEPAGLHCPKRIYKGNQMIPSSLSCLSASCSPQTCGDMSPFAYIVNVPMTTVRKHVVQLYNTKEYVGSTFSVQAQGKLVCSRTEAVQHRSELGLAEGIGPYMGCNSSDGNEIGKEPTGGKYCSNGSWTHPRRRVVS